VVTDSATEGAPIELSLSAEAGAKVLGRDQPTPGDTFYNIQVDTDRRAVGLYVRLEFPLGRDYDLWLDTANGDNIANARGWNAGANLGLIPSEGGHSEQTAEQIDGAFTRDCQGFTLDVVTATGEGGPLLLRMWLGKALHP
jgi:hypothetical protein